MSGFDAVRRRRLRTRRVAVVAALAVVAAVFVTSISSPPSSQRPTDVHGRTWVPVQTDDGPQLVLVNGISGLIEARATTTDPQPDGVKVVASTIDRTILGSADALTVVDNGHHVATSRTGITGTSATLVGDRVLTLGEQAELRGTDLDDAPIPVPVPAEIVADVAPVVDDDGRAWFLGDDDGELRAFGLRAGRGTDLIDREVADSTTGLLLVDGTAHATGPDGTSALNGGPAKPRVSGAPLIPSVAVDTDGLWVAADRRDLVVVGDDETRVRLDDPVTDLAIWNGSVVAATDSGAVVVSGTGDVEPIAELTDEVAFHTAGGLLWLSSRNTVVAIWPDHTRVPFELAAVDVDLCIGTCSADDISRFLDEKPPAPDSDRSTTTQAPRQLDPPSVDPTVPTTTAAPTTTTAPGPPPTTEQPTASTTSSIASSSTTEVLGPPDGESTTTSTEVDGSDPDPGDPGPTDPEPPPSWPTVPLPPDPPTTTTPPAPTTTSPPVTTTTAPPPGAVHLVLELDPSATSTVASLGLLGSRRDCRGAGLTGVDVGLRWSGAAEGSRQVRVPWSGGGDSDIVHVTIDHASGGTLDVTMEACRLTATRTATIPGDFPEISGIALNPMAPRPGQPFTARVGWELPDGWGVTSTAWSGGVCGATVPVGDNSPRQEQPFTAEEGRFCVSVIVTLAPPDGGSRNEERAVEFDVATTTSTSTTSPSTSSTTTSTSTSTSTTSTSTSTSTTTTSSTTTTTEPPDPPP